MNSPQYGLKTFELRRVRRLLLGGTGFLALFGLFWADNADGFIAYVLITLAAMLPAVLWLRANAPGIPILPAVAAFHYLYFAVPILKENLGGHIYGPFEIFRAGFTVASFLVIAALVWGTSLKSFAWRSDRGGPESLATGQIRRLVFGGIAGGIVFQLGVMLDWWAWLGTFFGVWRAIAITAASIGCYLLGHLRARALLFGRTWLLALGGVMVMVVASWSSLFLVGGMQYILSAGLGYVISAKRLPWRTAISLLMLLFILHAGKGEMREHYWVDDAYGRAPGPSRVPALFAEWLSDGITAVATGSVKQDVVDRASLLYMLLKVQYLTPDVIPYLGGATYALLPEYLTPRFLSADKTFSQAGLALLNLRYGIQTSEGIAYTTIGWGMIAEAFANFGYIGVFGAAVVFGLLSALFTRLSAGAAPLALANLLSVAALVSLTNLEADFGYLLTNLWQALVGAALFFVPLKYLSSGAESRTVRAMAATP